MGDRCLSNVGCEGVTGELAHVIERLDARMTSLRRKKERCPFDDDISRLLQGERIGEGTSLKRRDT